MLAHSGHLLACFSIFDLLQDQVWRSGILRCGLSRSRHLVGAISLIILNMINGNLIIYLFLIPRFSLSEEFGVFRFVECHFYFYNKYILRDLN